MFGLFRQQNPYKTMTPAQKAANIAITEMRLIRLKRELYELVTKRGSGYALSSDQAKELQKLANNGFINIKQGVCIGGNTVLQYKNNQLVISESK